MNKDNKLKTATEECNKSIEDILYKYDIYDDEVYEVLLDLISIISTELYRHRKEERKLEKVFIR